MNNLLKIIFYTIIISMLIFILSRIAYPPFSNRKLLPKTSSYADVHHEDRFDTKSHHKVWTYRAGRGYRNVENSSVIAIGGGITSTFVNFTKGVDLKKAFIFFSPFLESFCSTASEKFHYALYFAYDYSDEFFSNSTSLTAFENAFESFTSVGNCSNLSLSLHLVECNHTRRPAWAQNDAMMEAYLDGVDYFYRVNDDTLFITKGWTEDFINGLSKFEPQNLGVVGPNHIGGWTGILTYDFVHRTHVEVFGFYYPREFTDWFSDTWITEIYSPSKLTKFMHIKIIHLLILGSRYTPHKELRHFLYGLVVQSQAAISRYAYSKLNPKERNPRKVISMSLYGSATHINMGAIRNAQLLPIYFPGWTLRIYVGGVRVNPGLFVPERIVAVLKELGAQVVTVDSLAISLKPDLWSYQVVDDDDVDYFLIRKAEHRINDRDFQASEDFIHRFEADNKTGRAFHCLRDKISHAHSSVVPGLWGGKGPAVRKIFGVRKFMKRLSKFVRASESIKEERILHEFLWNNFSDNFLCHDSLSCPRWQKWSINFPLNSKLYEAKYTLGVEYDRHEFPLGYSESDEVAMRRRLPKSCDAAMSLGSNSVSPTTVAHVNISHTDVKNSSSSISDFTTSGINGTSVYQTVQGIKSKS